MEVKDCQRDGASQRRSMLLRYFRFFRILPSQLGKKLILWPCALSTSSRRRLQMIATPLRMWPRQGIALAVFLGLVCALSGSRILSAPQNASAQIDPKLF